MLGSCSCRKRIIFAAWHLFRQAWLWVLAVGPGQHAACSTSACCSVPHKLLPCLPGCRPASLVVEASAQTLRYCMPQHAMPPADPQHSHTHLLQGLGEALLWVCRLRRALHDDGRAARRAGCHLSERCGPLDVEGPQRGLLANVTFLQARLLLLHSWTGAGKHRSPHKWGVAVAWGNNVQPAPCFVASQPLFCHLWSCELLTVLLIVTCAGGVATCQHLCVLFWWH